VLRKRVFGCAFFEEEDLEVKEPDDELEKFLLFI